MGLRRSYVLLENSVSAQERMLVVISWGRFFLSNR